MHWLSPLSNSNLTNMALRGAWNTTTGAAARAAPLLQHFLSNQPVPWHGAACPCCQRTSHTTGADAADYAFEMATASIRFGSGVTREVGDDMLSMGLKKVMVVTDRNIAALSGGPFETTVRSLKAAGVPFVVYDEVSIEPTDVSLRHAIAAAKSSGVDGFVAVGGGSVMDTAKAANLYSSFPAQDFLDFVNAPVGRGMPVPGPVKPLIAIPTTAGTGSETTGVAIFDHTPMHAKTGIASRVIKPVLGMVDPLNMLTMPAQVAVASGFDVLCHALESYTAIPFNERRPRPSSPALRPAYQGANPISDVWSLHALRLLSTNFIAAVKDRSDDEANAAMALAATYAGVGFGNAGVHLCHGMSYAISGNNKSYIHPGYSPSKPLVPHGISVVLSAPAVFRFTAATNPARHLEAARILAGEDTPVRIHLYTGKSENIRPDSAKAGEDAGNALADQLLRFMDVLGVPNGLSALGYTEKDIPTLVEGTLPQKRVLNLAPGGASADQLTDLFQNTFKVY